MTAIQKAVLKAADASAAVRRHLSLDGDKLQVGDHRVQLEPDGKIFVIAIGKAAPSMASATSALLSRKVTEGLITEPQYPGIEGRAKKVRLSRAFTRPSPSTRFLVRGVWMLEYPRPPYWVELTERTWYWCWSPAEHPP